MSGLKSARVLCMTVAIFTQVVNKLRCLLTQLDEIKKEREELEGEVKSVRFDISDRCLTALAQNGTINEEELSKEELEQCYGKSIKAVSKNLLRQEELLGEVQVCFQRKRTLNQACTDITVEFLLTKLQVNSTRKSIKGPTNTRMCRSRNHLSTLVREKHFTL